MHQRYGKLPWKDLFEPVIAHAEAGAPVPDMIAYYIRRSLAGFRQPGRGIEETDNALRTYGLNDRSEEHTSELQSLMRISSDVFCLKKKKNNRTKKHHNDTHQAQTNTN